MKFGRRPEAAAESDRSSASFHFHCKHPVTEKTLVDRKND